MATYGPSNDTERKDLVMPGDEPKEEIRLTLETMFNHWPRPTSDRASRFGIDPKEAAEVREMRRSKEIPHAGVRKKRS